jgi:hypothetical protein
MISETDVIILIISLKDNLIIIALFHYLYLYYGINNYEFLWSIKLALLLIIQYSIIPIRYKLNYFTNKLISLHKLFCYEFVFNNYFGEQHLYLFYHESCILKYCCSNISLYEKESYLNDIKIIINYNKLIIKDYINKPDYDCPICLSDNINWIILPCKHKAHVECLKKWFITSKDSKCPLCMNNCDDNFINLLIN